MAALLNGSREMDGPVLSIIDAFIVIKLDEQTVNAF